VLEGVGAHDEVEHAIAKRETTSIDGKNRTIDAHTATETTLGCMLLLRKAVDDDVSPPVRLVSAPDVEHQRVSSHGNPQTTIDVGIQ
jgi:hypothetical protein